MSAKRQLPSAESRRTVLRYAFFVAVMLGVAIPVAAGAQGWWWGSPINPGFDTKTVVEVAGTVAAVKIVDQGGPSTLRLQIESEILDVVLAPGWFLAQQKMDLRTGDGLLVEGSRVPDRKGKIHLIAARLTNTRTGRTLALRDEAGRPLWGARRKVQP
jgi:hypothetical protein